MVFLGVVPKMAALGACSLAFVASWSHFAQVSIGQAEKFCICIGVSLYLLTFSLHKGVLNSLRMRIFFQGFLFLGIEKGDTFWIIKDTHERV